MSTAADESLTADSSTIFATHIRYVLDREFERADRSTGRAEKVFRSQVAILTVAIGVIAFVYRDGHGLALDVGTARIFGGATIVAVVALVAAAVGQSIAVKSKLTDGPTMDKMLSPEHWHGDPNALYVTACRDRESIEQLRKSNDKRARISDVALWSQVGSVVLATAALAHEIASRLGWM